MRCQFSTLNYLSVFLALALASTVASAGQPCDVTVSPSYDAYSDIQDALDKVSELTLSSDDDRRVVCLEEGLYGGWSTKSYLELSENTVIRGAGPGSTLLVGGNEDENLFSVSVSGCSVESLTIKGFISKKEEDPVASVSGELEFVDVEFDDLDCDHAVSARGGTVTLTDCVVRAVGTSAFYVNGDGTLTAVNTVFNECGSDDSSSSSTGSDKSGSDKSGSEDEGSDKEDKESEEKSDDGGSEEKSDDGGSEEKSDDAGSDDESDKSDKDKSDREMDARADSIDDDKESADATIRGTFGTVNLIDCTVINHGCDSNSKASFAHITTDAVINVINSSFADNYGKENGGIFYITGKLNMRGSVASNTDCKKSGGVVFASEGGAVTITNSVFYGNSAKKDGSVMYIEGGSSAVLTSVHMYDNYADDAVVYANDDSTLEFHDSAIVQSIEGHAITVDKDSTVTLYHSVVTEADDYGIKCSKSSVYIKSDSFVCDNGEVGIEIKSSCDIEGDADSECAALCSDSCVAKPKNKKSKLCKKDNPPAICTSCAYCDTDECALGTHDCSATEDCVDEDNGWRCELSTVCSAATQLLCDELATCKISGLSHICECPTGYVTVDAGVNCLDVDECLTGSHDCGEAASCSNTAGSYTCACTTGWTDNTGDGTVCHDNDECESGSHNCAASASCANTAGSFACSCPTGYSSSDGGASCAEVDECATGTHNCDANAECSNTDGSFECSCAVGFTTTNGGASCSDVNECSDGTDNCAAEATCTNTAGSYSCACASGYTSGDSGVSCADVDECSTGSHSCDLNAECSNTDGSFSCGCSSGYIANVLGACIDDNECLSGDDNCAAEATCTNSAGSFSCACASGYTSSDGGVSCDDVDECSAGTHSCSDNSACVNTLGSFSCECNAGYIANVLGACIDDNECLSGDDNCADTATCVNSAGSFSCDCASGYSTSDGGVSCDDVDECVTGSHNCDANAECSNSVGSFSCACATGYSSLAGGTVCSNIDECAAGTHDCSGAAGCVDTVGSFSCGCPSGYIASDGSASCDDVDECSSGTHSCSDNSACVNSDGSFSCDCDTGYILNLLGICVDADECLTGEHGCAAEASCTNTAGSYTCSCASGYTSSDGGVSCSDVDECTAGTDDCDVNSACVNTFGSFTCDCNIGYSKVLGACVDNDECLADSNNCADGASCANTDGSFACSCASGYSSSDGGVSCSDVDECASGAHSCDANAVCSNTAGSYTCTCNAGYVAGVSGCSDINECVTGADNCGDVATCSNTAGSFSCTCPSGYSSSDAGVTCADVDECEDGSDSCDANSDCVNNVGSYSCDCVVGYTAVLGSCVDVDECLTGADNCAAEASCTNTAGSFECACASGYTSNNDGVSCSDVDECSSGGHNCDGVAECANTASSFTCGCGAGYTSLAGGTVCADVDECLTDADNCAAEAVCANSDGSFSCACVIGYSSTDGGVSCDDVDECSTGAHDCDANAACVNTGGSFSCDCDVGYTMVLGACVDDDECLLGVSNCADEAECTNSDGSFSCTCSSGYTSTDGGVSCTDVDECTTGTHDCGANSACSNTVGGYTCDCVEGYVSVLGLCADVDECLTDSHNCAAEAACTNSAGSFSCACGAGYTSDDGGVTCSDVDECDANSHNCAGQAECSNTVGSFTCACNAGYTSLVFGTVCTDSDECLTGADNCGANSRCANSEGSFACSCVAGYAEDYASSSSGSSSATVSCSDVDECAADSHNCDLAAECTNSLGSFTCSCPTGYVSVDGGVTCVNGNECLEQTHNCDPRAACLDIDGGFTCLCPDGFASDDGGATCLDVNECTVDSELSACSGAAASCVNTLGSFMCDCVDGYTAGLSTPCVDLDECSQVDFVTGCSPAVDDCVNTVGSFECVQVASPLTLQLSADQISEAGGEAAVTIRLLVPPLERVTLPIRVLPRSDGRPNKIALTANAVVFEAGEVGGRVVGDADERRSSSTTPHESTVGMRSVDDDSADGDSTETVVVGPAASADPRYNTSDTETVSVVSIDDDAAAIMTAVVSRDTNGTRSADSTPITWSSANASAGVLAIGEGVSEPHRVVAVRLAAAPLADVVVPVAVSDGTVVAATPANLSFTPATWAVPQFVSVAAYDNAIASGNESFSVDLGPATGASAFVGAEASVDGVVVDDDVPGLSISLYTPSDSSASSSSSSSSSSLSGSGRRRSSSRRSDGDSTHGGAAKEGFTTETGVSTMVIVRLATAPTASVSVYLTSSDTSEGEVVTPQPLVLDASNWDSGVNATVVGVDDSQLDGMVSCSVGCAAVASSGDAAYDSLACPDDASVSLVNVDDDDERLVQLSQPSVASLSESTAGSGMSYVWVAVVVDTGDDDVTVESVSNSPSQLALSSGASLVFTPSNRGIPQRVALTAVDDAIADGDVTATITATAAGYPSSAETVSLTVADDDTAGFVLSAPSRHTNELGDSATFTVALSSEPLNNIVVVQVRSEDSSEGSVPADSRSLQFRPADWSSPQTVTVVGERDRNNDDGDVAYTVSLSVTGAGGSDYSGVEDTVELVNDNVVWPEVDTVLDAELSVLLGWSMAFEGSGFLPGLTVLIGGDEATNVTWVSDSRVEFISPLQSEVGYYDYTVVNPDGGWYDGPSSIYYTDDCPFPGQYGRGLDCVDCPEGAECPGGYRMWPLPGYWSPDETAGYVVPCDPPDRCEGGPLSKCADGNEGRMCGGCDEGYYRAGKVCVKCTSIGMSRLLMVTDGVLLALFLAGALILHHTAFRGAVTAVTILQILRLVGRLSTDGSESGNELAPPVEIFYNSLALTTGEGVRQDGCGGTSSNFVDNFFLDYAVMGLVLLILQCIVPCSKSNGDASDTAALKPVAVGGDGAGHGASAHPAQSEIGRKRRRRRHHHAADGSAATATDKKLADADTDVAPVAGGEAGAAGTRCCEGPGSSRRLAVTLIFFVFIYANVTVLNFQAISCYTIASGERVLSVDNTVECFKGTHLLCFTVAVASLVLFSAGFPIGMAALLLWKSNDLRSDYYSSKFGVFYAGLKPRYILHVVAWLGVLAAAAAAVALFGRDADGRIIFCAFFVAAYLGYALVCRPYTEGWKFFTLVAVLFVALLGLVYGYLLARPAAVSPDTHGVFATTIVGGGFVIFVALVIRGIMYAWAGRSSSAVVAVAADGTDLKGDRGMRAMAHVGMAMSDMSSSSLSDGDASSCWEGGSGTTDDSSSVLTLSTSDDIFAGGRNGGVSSKKSGRHSRRASVSGALPTTAANPAAAFAAALAAKLDADDAANGSGAARGDSAQSNGSGAAPGDSARSNGSGGSVSRSGRRPGRRRASFLADDLDDELTGDSELIFDAPSVAAATGGGNSSASPGANRHRRRASIATGAPGVEWRVALAAARFKRSVRRAEAFGGEDTIGDLGSPAAASPAPANDMVGRGAQLGKPKTSFYGPADAGLAPDESFFLSNEASSRPSTGGGVAMNVSQGVAAMKPDESFFMAPRSAPGVDRSSLCGAQPDSSQESRATSAGSAKGRGHRRSRSMGTQSFRNAPSSTTTASNNGPEWHFKSETVGATAGASRHIRRASLYGDDEFHDGTEEVSSDLCSFSSASYLEPTAATLEESFTRDAFFNNLNEVVSESSSDDGEDAGPSGGAHGRLTPSSNLWASGVTPARLPPALPTGVPVRPAPALPSSSAAGTGRAPGSSFYGELGEPLARPGSIRRASGRQRRSVGSTAAMHNHIGAAAFGIAEPDILEASNAASVIPGNVAASATATRGGGSAGGNGRSRRHIRRASISVF